MFKNIIFVPLFFVFCVFSAQSKESGVLIIAGQPFIPKGADKRATEVFVNVSSQVSNYLKTELKNSKFESETYFEKSNDKTDNETVDYLLKTEKHKAFVLVYVKYLNINGSNVVAIVLQCKKALTGRDGSKLESNVEGVFDMVSKPERTTGSVAIDFSKLLLQSTCLK